jgi:hypothetical protein
MGRPRRPPARLKKCLICRHKKGRGRSSVGRASASQAEGRGFETRRPLGGKAWKSGLFCFLGQHEAVAGNCRGQRSGCRAAIGTERRMKRSSAISARPASPSVWDAQGMSHSLRPLLAGLPSPTRFDPAHEICQDEIEVLLQAARWAPLAGNSQPWAFIVAAARDRRACAPCSSLGGELGHVGTQRQPAHRNPVAPVRRRHRLGVLRVLGL